MRFAPAPFARIYLPVAFVALVLPWLAACTPQYIREDRTDRREKELRIKQHAGGTHHATVVDNVRWLQTFGNELLVMTATPDVGSRLLALLRAASHVLCDRPSLPLVEQSLRQNRSQLMRLPQVHCAQSYLGTATIDLLRKEIGLQSAA